MGQNESCLCAGGCHSFCVSVNSAIAQFCAVHFSLIACNKYQEWVLTYIELVLDCYDMNFRGSINKIPKMYASSFNIDFTENAQMKIGCY